MSTEERLVYMANQIARNFAIAGGEPAALATADHIAAFWDPSMKEKIFARAAAGETGLSAIAEAAIAHLQKLGSPAPQTSATQFGDPIMPVARMPANQE